MSRENQMRAVAILNQLRESLGGNHPGSSVLSISHENLTNEIKHKANLSVELFDEHIRKLVNAFFEFSAIYRENHTERFVTDIKNLLEVLNTDEKTFVDKIRWSDDKTYVDNIRKPVSFAYLDLFTEASSLKVVVSEDFWKCSDFDELKRNLYKTKYFRSIATLFTVENAYDQVNSMLNLIMELRLACVKLSTDYEQVLTNSIGMLQRGESFSVTDTIDYDKHQAVVLGTVLTADITNAINQKWYQNQLTSSIGSMVKDTRLLLAEPLRLCTPNNSDRVEAVSNFFTYANKAEASDNLKLLQREFINLVEQIDLSSRRLTKVIERIQEIPDIQGSGDFDSTLEDLSVLISIYSGTLSEVLIFVTEVAKLIEQTFEETNHLVNKVNTLKIEVDRYISQRLKNNENFR